VPGSAAGAGGCRGSVTVRVPVVPEKPMSGHLPAQCCCHVFTPACPVDCLRVVLGRATFHALALAELAPFARRATVGQVLDLWRAGRLGLAARLGPRRLGEIEAGLVLAGLTLTGDSPSEHRARRRRADVPDVAGRDSRPTRPQRVTQAPCGQPSPAPGHGTGHTGTAGPWLAGCQPRHCHTGVPAAGTSRHQPARRGHAPAARPWLWPEEDCGRRRTSTELPGAPPGAISVSVRPQPVPAV
jgi:hypothetical protein